MTQADFEGFKREIIGTLRWYLGSVMAIFITFFGWLAISHMTLQEKVRDNRQEVQDIKRDMGHSFIESSTYHPESGVFEKMAEKYNPYRTGIVINK